MIKNDIREYRDEDEAKDLFDEVNSKLFSFEDWDNHEAFYFASYSNDDLSHFLNAPRELIAATLRNQFKDYITIEYYQENWITYKIKQ